MLLSDNEENTQNPKRPRSNSTSRIQSQSFSLKLKKIKKEMEYLNPDTLLEKIDPTINSTQTIEQIQKYYNLINIEIQRYFHQEQEKKEITKKNAELNKQIAEMIKPPLKNYIKEFSQEENNNKDNSTSKENKPVIDYRVKIRSLEKDIMYTYQDYNNIKSKNSKLREELDELRKKVIQKSQRLKELKDSLEEKEKKYYEQKKEIENNMNNKEENDILDQIKKNQKVLEKTNIEMIEKIKETDAYLTKKQARKKCLEFEANQLENLHKKLEEKNKKELDDFNKLYKDDIEKVKNFDESSKIIDMLDTKKITELDEMLRDMFEETKTENIQSFVDYFIKSYEEYKAFQDSIDVISKKVITLEKEVDELEYIINFCEQNLEVVNKNNLDEEEMKELEKLKQCTDKFIEVQYDAIHCAYIDFKDQLSELFLRYQPNLKDNDDFNNNFLQFFADYLRKEQDNFKNIAQNIKKRNMKAMKEVFDFNKWDSKWERTEKIKENVKKDYEKNGPGSLKLDFKAIRRMVEDDIIGNNNRK